MAKKRLPKGDRLQLTIKDYGDTVEIYSPRGKIVCKRKDSKTITIRYGKSRLKKTDVT